MDDKTISALASGEPDPHEVTESCGCVFCDLGLEPYMVNGKLKHDYIGPDGYLIVCAKPTQQ